MITYKNVYLFVGRSLLKCRIVYLQLPRLVAAGVRITRSLTRALSLLLYFIAHPIWESLLSRSIVVSVAIPLLAWRLVGGSYPLILIVENVFNALNIFFKSLIKR